MEKQSLQASVDFDLTHSREVWEEYAHDADIMSALFLHLYSTYKDEIAGFCADLQVIQPYEPPAAQAAAYRENIQKMLNRLAGFRENGYQNEGLMEYYLSQEQQEISFKTDITDLRFEFGMMKHIPQHEKDEIIEKLGEMEEILSQVVFKRQKWDMLRGYLVWLSGKDVDIAMKILPVFFKINNV